MAEAEPPRQSTPPAAPPSDPAKDPAADKGRGRWATAAGMGIGSAALVAALLYANRGRDRKPKA